ncbi:syntaxin-11b.2 [Chanos chanos]|uniref:Syntaxin-11b.2 n=1 Tax=Chanos chanos TaxID=29144 RepID=A0A6J2VA11_CHACN|nr:syntaxin-11-like [Chanos chanos]
MRDRLSHLQALSGGNGYLEGLEYTQSASPTTDKDQAESHQDSNPEMEAVFDEAQDARLEIQLIRLEVKRLREQNSRMLTEATPTSSDSNAIASDIKKRGEGMLVRLHKMDANAKKLEEEHGVNSAVARIARTQYASLSNSFRDAMMDYNEAEMSHRETCKAHIQRQMEIVGREVTGDQIEEMLENGQWNVFTQNLLSEGKTARSALNQIESRHMELLELESRIRGIHEVFLDVAMLVEEQQSMVDYIHTNVQKTDVEIKGVLLKLETAKRHDRNNPFKKLLFWNKR